MVKLAVVLALAALAGCASFGTQIIDDENGTEPESEEVAVVEKPTTKTDAGIVAKHDASAVDASPADAGTTTAPSRAPSKKPVDAGHDSATIDLCECTAPHEPYWECPLQEPKGCGW